MTLVKQAVTNEIAVSSGSDQWSGLLDEGWMLRLVSTWWNTGKSCHDSQQQYANSGSRVPLARHPSENLAREKWQSSTLEE